MKLPGHIDVAETEWKPYCGSPTIGPPAKSIACIPSIFAQSLSQLCDASVPARAEVDCLESVSILEHILTFVVQKDFGFWIPGLVKR